jgi:Tfp pilus assembly protein PilF
MKIRVLILLIFIALTACVANKTTRQANESDFHTNIGFAYYIEKNYQLAYTEFHKALQLNPNNRNALHGLALVHMEFQEYEIAKELFLRTLSIDSNYADAWFNLGLCYQNLNMHIEAIKAFGKALNNPLFTMQDKAYFGQGLSYYRIGRYDEAKSSFDKAIKRNFLLSQAHLFMALTYQKMGFYFEASKTLKQAIKFDTNYKGDLDKFKKNLIDALKTGQKTLPKEDILDFLEILKY